MIPVKNLTESVKSRLHSIAIARHEDFNLTLIRYGVERLLYRLSKSDYKDQFLLKGAMLFMLWDALPHRPTKDLDLLGFVPAEKKILVGIFREIVGAEVEPDGLAFDRENIIPTEILENNRYGGTRIKLIAWLGNARIPIQIDIGSGDVVTPAPEPVRFPRRSSSYAGHAVVESLFLSNPCGETHSTKLMIGTILRERNG